QATQYGSHPIRSGAGGGSGPADQVGGPGRARSPGREPANITGPSDRKCSQLPACARLLSRLSGAGRLSQGGCYPDPGGDWGLVALLVFKTSAPARIGGRVRFPSASANGLLPAETGVPQLLPSRAPKAGEGRMLTIC